MINLKKKKDILKEVNQTLKFVRLMAGQSKIESWLQLQMNNIFKIQHKKFWELEKKNDWLNKIYLQATKDLMKIEKANARKIKYVADLTKNWNDEMNKDKTMSKVLKSTYIEGYNLAGQEVLNEFKIKENFNLRNLDFLEALEERANITSPGINKTSWEMVNNKIATGFWDEGKNPKKVAQDIKGLFEETYKGRAENIAITETGQVFSEATLKSYNKMGVEKKEWGAELDACELCLDLDHQQVNINENFKSKGWQGQSPLRHPRCRCFLLSVIPEDFKVEDYWNGE
jgi:SPP1 gp7 family putative phage head morphogenesis protein